MRAARAGIALGVILGLVAMAAWSLLGPSTTGQAGEEGPELGGKGPSSPSARFGESTNWSPPPIRPFPRVAADASPTLPRSLSSTRSILSVEALAPYRRLAPPGPARRWLEGIKAVKDPDEYQERVEAYKREREPIDRLPQMVALRALANHVANYRMIADFAQATALTDALLQRELELKGVGYDGEVPPDHVQAQACAWVGVGEDCSLPDYVSCVAAQELDATASRICADPLAPFDERTLVPTPDALRAVSRGR